MLEGIGFDPSKVFEGAEALAIEPRVLAGRPEEVWQSVEFIDGLLVVDLPVCDWRSRAGRNKCKGDGKLHHDAASIAQQVENSIVEIC